MKRSAAARSLLPACVCLAVALACPARAAEPAPKYAGRTLEEALKGLGEGGLKLVYSSALVRPEMKVAAEPAGPTPVEALQELLAPHGLRARSGPGGAVLIVRIPRGEKPASPIGAVSFVSVVSDKVPDVSSLEAWKKSFLKPGMSDQEKALAVWRSVVAFQHQDSPPNEFLHEGESVRDTIKIFNVYGYSMCDAASANMECLARAAGLEARGRIVAHHSVPEVKWDGAWRLLDGSLIAYYPKADGSLAGVDEIIAGVSGWLDAHPEMRGSDEKLGAFMRGEGWKKGPEILTRTKFYDGNGWLPAATHGWYSTMQEFDCKPDQVYEYGYTEGYRVNIQLRQGERLTRNWSNQRLHVNMKGGGGAPGCLKMEVGKESLRYAPDFGDLAPGRVGNGLLEYHVPLANGAFRNAAVLVVNLAARAEDGKDPAIHAIDDAKDGVLELRMPSSYVYLTGTMQFEAAIGPDGGSVAAYFSDNHGLDWERIGESDKPGERKIDLSSLVLRKYDYRIRFVFKGRGTGLEALSFRHDIQHSQRALPALGEGKNTITFAAGPAESTLTLEGSLNPANKGKQLTYADFHPSLRGIDAQAGGLWVKEAAGGSVTFPVETPYEMTRLRFGSHYRVRDARDVLEYQVSFDDGQTWTTVETCKGPTPGHCAYRTFSGMPAGTRKALVRYAGVSRNTTGIMQFRIDADYKEVRGGFAPVKVSYYWEENGQEKKDEHVATRQNETYTIDCPARPVMKSIVLERAD
ncbi:MAG: hypothetical protein KIS92_12435 [Planctomycetota bacterium]|nr:hypothetical protein [Planctomycetota bacterium]